MRDAVFEERAADDFLLVLREAFEADFFDDAFVLVERADVLLLAPFFEAPRGAGFEDAGRFALLRDGAALLDEREAEAEPFADDFFDPPDFDDFVAEDFVPRAGDFDAVRDEPAFVRDVRLLRFAPVELLRPAGADFFDAVFFDAVFFDAVFLDAVFLDDAFDDFAPPFAAALFDDFEADFVDEERGAFAELRAPVDFDDERDDPPFDEDPRDAPPRPLLREPAVAVCRLTSLLKRLPLSSESRTARPSRSNHSNHSSHGISSSVSSPL